MQKNKVINNRFIIGLLFIYVLLNINRIYANMPDTSKFVPIEIRLCDFPDNHKKGILFINYKKKVPVKSGDVYVFSYPADSLLHLNIKLGGTNYVQDGYYLIDKTGGVITVHYFFRDTLEREVNSNTHSKLGKSGWIGVEYYPGFRVRKPTSKKKLPLGRQMLGADRDAYGCLPSGGYRWSDAAQLCIRLWEVGYAFTDSNGIISRPDQMNDILGFVVFSADGHWAELFASSNWDVCSTNKIWLLEKFGEEWRYSGRLNIKIKATDAGKQMKIYLNNNKTYTINNN
ncbi:MAG: hypothetical protein RLZZ161_1917 [Bacteroidota bacterium]